MRRIEGAFHHLLRGIRRGSVSSTERSRKLAHSPNKDTHICRSVSVSSVPGGVTGSGSLEPALGVRASHPSGCIRRCFTLTGYMIPNGTGTREVCEGTRQFRDELSKSTQTVFTENRLAGRHSLLNTTQKRHRYV